MTDTATHQPQKSIQNTRAPATRTSARTARFLSRAEAICRARNVRWTPIRRRVLELLCNVGKPMGAYDLAECISASGRRMAPITVYRTLEFLMAQGLAHRLASQNAFIASLNGSNGRTTTFLICEECGGVDEIVSTERADCLTGMLRGKGFQPRARMLEVTGRCSRCWNSTRVFFGESDPARRSKVRSNPEERDLT